MRRWLMALLAAVVAALPAVGCLLLAQPAAAASLVQVTNFGNNPSSLQMYVYVPNSVTPNPAILVALHQCTGAGAWVYSRTQFASLADPYGVIVIYPSV